MIPLWKFDLDPPSLFICACAAISLIGLVIFA
jgi:hypothetical protein